MRTDFRLINCHTQAWFCQTTTSTTIPKRQIFERQTIPDQIAIETAFKVTNVGNIAGEMTSGGRQNSCFSNLATKLVAEVVFLSQ